MSDSGIFCLVFFGSIIGFVSIGFFIVCLCDWINEYRKKSFLNKYQDIQQARFAAVTMQNKHQAFLCDGGYYDYCKQEHTLRTSLATSTISEVQQKSVKIEDLLQKQEELKRQADIDFNYIELNAKVTELIKAKNFNKRTEKFIKDFIWSYD